MILNTKAHTLWRTLARAANSPILMLSPYLTGPLAEQILRAAGRSKVYTRFEVELFASRASSLVVLERLLEAGHELYHLDALHAKVVIEADKFATIGSQNVTSGGLNNLELNGYCSDIEFVATAHSLIKPWLDKAVPITPQMIEDMKALLPPLEAIYDELYKACTAAQDNINRSAARAQRRVEREEVRRAQAELRKDIQSALEAAPTSEERDLGSVSLRDTYCDTGAKTSLFSRRKDFLTWTVAGSSLTLIRLSRYLCIDGNGQIGWARVAQTRISMVGRGIDFEGQVIAEHPSWEIEVISRENYLDGFAKDANLLITVTQYDRKLCVVPVRFALSSYKAFSPRPIHIDGDESFEGKSARAWIREHMESFERQVINRVTRTFKYNGNLLGEDATFFGPLGSEHVVTVALVDRNPILFVRSA